MKAIPPGAACPCGRADPRNRPLAYGRCCGLWLEGGNLAPDAQTLMRSRYTAFTLEREEYLLRTWHRRYRPLSVPFDAGVRWLGLEVRSHVVHAACQAEVEFVARQRLPGAAAVRLHERSRFVREDGCWWYLDGDLL
jgi:SEC-C motif-containing protein